MNDILIYFFVALGLSMDAFSLAIIYGVSKLPLKKMFELSFCVGVFHFFMPFIGGNIGGFLHTKLAISSNIIVSIVFFIIAVSMFKSIYDEEDTISLDKFYYFLLFSFTVSLDSLSVGIAYGIMKEEMLIASLIFSIVSFCFTFIGLIIGLLFGNKCEKISKFIGALILLFLSFKYIFLN